MPIEKRDCGQALQRPQPRTEETEQEEQLQHHEGARAVGSAPAFDLEHKKLHKGTPGMLGNRWVKEYTSGFERERVPEHTVDTGAPKFHKHGEETGEREPEG